jgi:hypothetical protein
VFFTSSSMIKASTSTGIQSTASKVPNVSGRAPRCFELVTMLGSHSFLFHTPFPSSGPQSAPSAE